MSNHVAGQTTSGEKNHNKNPMVGLLGISIRLGGINIDLKKENSEGRIRAVLQYKQVIT